MEKFLSFLLVFTTFLCHIGVSGLPADHREDTVLPFSLSPGNVNLETYYLNKYPKPGPGGQLKQKVEPPSLTTEGNGVQEGGQQPNGHAIFRSRRSSHSMRNHEGSGYHNQGHFLSQPMSYSARPHHHNQHNKHSAHHESQYSRYNLHPNVFADRM